MVENAGDFSEKVLNGDFEHVLGDREKAVGTFREFVFFHEASIYPEYAVFYRREKGGKILPPSVRSRAPEMETMEAGRCGKLSCVRRGELDCKAYTSQCLHVTPVCACPEASLAQTLRRLSATAYF